jgi:hypothetical protein
MKNSSHWYKHDGTACYEVPYADPKKGMRKTTLADARKLNLLPSVTTITKVLAAPSLIEWLRREAAIAVATTPRNHNEPLDDFVERCLAVDAEATADKAKQLGTDIHDAINQIICGQSKNVQEHLLPFASPAAELIYPLGRVFDTEKILIANHYAGKTDCLLENDEAITVVDFKTTGAKKLPEKSYPEHRLQLAAYAFALGNVGSKRIVTTNIYISTIRPGEIKVIENPDWQTDFAIFQMVLKIWQWQNNFKSLPHPTENNDVPS